MSKVLVGFAGVAVAAVLLAGNVIMISNDAIVQEEAIEATFNNNKNILSQYTTRIGELAQIPAMARDDLQEVLQGAMEGRYGENGSQAAVQLIVENYPGKVDPSLYSNIQNEISAGRRKFEENQKRLIDQKRVYNQKLRFFWSGFVLKALGYPKKDMDQFIVVESSAAQKSFETGIDDGVKLR